MSVKGEAGPMGHALNVSASEMGWGLVIRRKDDQSHGAFFEYHDKEMSPEDLRRFVPDPDALEWKHFKSEDPPLAHESVHAEAGDYLLNVIPLECEPDVALEAFKKFVKS